MKALPTLIRIAKRELDELRGALGEIEMRRDAALNRLAAQAQELAAEQQAAMQTYEASRAYHGFAAAALAQRRATEAQIADLETEAGRIRALVAEAHVELKKLERLMELQAERAAAAERKAEDAALDEMATLRAARKS